MLRKCQDEKTSEDEGYYSIISATDEKSENLIYHIIR